MFRRYKLYTREKHNLHKSATKR